MSGDPPTPTPQESTAQMISAYTAGLPGLMNTYNSQIAPNELAQLAASQQVSPGYAKLQNEIYKLYGPEAAQTTLDIAKLQDPEYYAVREAAGKQLLDLINNPVSGSQREELQRYVNRGNMASGNATNPSAVNTTSNAMAFGNQARTNLLDALGKANESTPLLNANKQTFTEARTTGAQTNTGAQVAGQSSGLLSGISGNMQTAMDTAHKRRSGFDRTMGAVGGAAEIFGKLW